MTDKFEPSWAVGDKNTWDALVRSMMAGGIGLVDADGTKTPISADFGGGGGSSLPEVSAADNGDVLTVVEGEWAKAAPSGGRISFDYVLTFTWNESETSVTASDTYDDIIARINNGEKVGARMGYVGSEDYLYSSKEVERTIAYEQEGVLLCSFYSEWEHTAGFPDTFIGCYVMDYLLKSDNSIEAYYLNYSVAGEAEKMYPSGDDEENS